MAEQQAQGELPEGLPAAGAQAVGSALLALSEAAVSEIQAGQAA